MKSTAYGILPLCSSKLLTDLQKIDAICGDLDSLRPDVQQHYRDKGATISKDPDQYATDFTKCLKHLNSIAEPSKKRKATGSRLDTVVSFDVAVIGGLGGRADQAFSQLHHLYTASVGVGNRYKDVYLITPESIIFLLLEGLNIIRTPVESDLLGEAIGIIPIAKSSVITARGLEWDVEDWQTEFGTQISTSNHIRDSHVEVETSEKVLFTVEIARKPEQTDETRSAKRRRLESEEDDREATVLVKGITESIGKITERLNGPAPSVLISNVASKLDGLATCIQNNSEGMQKTMERMFNVIQMMADIIDKKVNTTRVEKVESLVRENIKITSDLDLSVIMNQKDNKIQGQEMISALKLVAGKIRDAEWKPTIMDASLSDEELNSS